MQYLIFFNYMRIVCFLLILYSTAFAFPTQKRPSNRVGAVAFLVETQARNQRIPCTGSLINLAGHCGLFIAKHCIPSSVNQITVSTIGVRQADELWESDFDFHSWWPWFATEQELGFKSITASVVKRSLNSDLIELKLDDNDIQKRICTKSQLVQQKPMTSEKMERLRFGAEASVASFGFEQGLPKVRYTNNGIWPAYNHISGLLDVYHLSSKSNDVLFQCHDLDLNPGMSGGFALLDNAFRVLGIHSRSVPLQSIGLVLPLNTIAEILEKTESQEESLSRISNKELLTDDKNSILLAQQNNNQIVVGGNSQTDPGGNSQTDPGGNSQTDPSGANTEKDTHRLNVSLLKSNPLKVISEADEGFIMSENPSKILLGINGMQIDGEDDYHKKYVPASDTAKKTSITRDKSGFPSDTIRKNLFTRLNGTYQTDEKTKRFSRHFIYESNDKESIGWERKRFGIGTDSLIVNEAGNEIILINNRGYVLFLDSNSRQADLEEKNEVKFRISFDDEAKKIWLHFTTNSVNGNAIEQKLECENRHYLKLICKNEEYNFSLSRSTEANQDGQLEYRFARAYRDQGKKMMIDYRFGTLVPERENGHHESR